MSRFLLRLLGAIPSPGDAVPDAELLRRYASAGDAAAFELLVRRHADSVWAACARVLRNDADADDAFQTTFLVLARKAGSVRGACAGGWLHRVAVNAALKLRSGRTRSVSDGVEVGNTPSLTLRVRPDPDDFAALHEELARLPDRYRLPVVLCDLEGHSRTSAAKVLGWPPGSVAGRLARARDLLRDRLTRRGFAPMVLVACAAPARAVSAAVGVVSGSITTSPVVGSLTAGVLSAMRIAKLKMIAVAVGLVAAVGFGAAVAARSGQDRPPVVAGPPEKPAENDITRTAFPELKLPLREGIVPDNPAERERLVDEARRAFARACPNMMGSTPVRLDATDDTYRRLLKGQLEMGRYEIQKTLISIDAGKFAASDFATVLATLKDLRGVAAELWANDPKVLGAWHEEFVLLAKRLEAFEKVRVDTGTDASQQLDMAIRHRLNAEAALWKVKHPAKR